MLTYADLDTPNTSLQQECGGRGFARIVVANLVVFGMALVFMHVVL